MKKINEKNEDFSPTRTTSFGNPQFNLTKNPSGKSNNGRDSANGSVPHINNPDAPKEML
jgi:hypothetical protein